MNRLQLTASVVEREPVRYTPAGVPIASCTLHHRTEVVEAGIARPDRTDDAGGSGR